MKCWQFPTVFFLCCLGTLTPTRAATITGTLRNITGAVHPDKRVVFTPVDTPRNLPNGSVLWTPTQVTSVNGVFTVVLGPGHYRVSIDGIVWAYRCVPDSEDTFTFNSADLMCHSNTGIYLSTNQLYKVLTSTNDGFPSYLYSSLLAGTNIFLEDIDDGSGTNRVVKINSSGGGRTGNNTQFDDDGTTLTITNISGVAGATQWTNDAGIFHPINQTLQPQTDNGWFFGPNSAALWGGDVGNYGFIQYRDVSLGDVPAGGIVVYAQQAPGAAIGVFDLVVNTNQSNIQAGWNDGPSAGKGFSVLMDPDDTLLSMADIDGTTRVLFHPSETSATIASIAHYLDTETPWTQGTLFGVKNNGTNLLSTRWDGGLVWGPGTTNVLRRSIKDLVYTNSGDTVNFQVGRGAGEQVKLGLSTGGHGQIIAGTGSDFYIGVNNNGSGDFVFTPLSFSSTGNGVDDLGGPANKWAETHTIRVMWDDISNVFDAYGAGTPEGAVTAGVGSTFRRTDGGSGTTLYSKTSGTGNTGWEVVGAGGGGSSDNWVASGSTNSTLPGIGSAYALIATNGFYAGNGFYAPWWTASVDDTLIGVHDVSQGDSDYSFFYVGNVDDGSSETNYADLTVSLSTSSLSPAAILTLAAVATNKVSTFSVNLQPDQGVARLELFNDGTNTFTVLDDSGYTGAGTKALMDDGTYKTPSGGAGTAGTVINTGASVVGAVPAYTDLTGTNVAPTSVTISGADLTGGVLQSTKAFRSYQGSLTHAGTVTLSLDAPTTVNQITLTGAVTFALSNLATNRTYRLRINNPQATNCTVTLPANTSTNFFGGAPTYITAGKVAIWSMEAWGTGNADVFSAWSETQ